MKFYLDPFCIAFLPKCIVVLGAENNDYGAEVTRCAQMLTSGGKYTEAQVRQAIDSLAAEGHIYSTMDENHYQFAM
jgi:hypothetical protein